MAKFKVGDKVRILDASKIVDAIELGFKTGEICEVVEIDVYNVLFISNGKSWLQIFEEELQYIEKVNKPTKNQRITALEKEVAELRPLKEKVEYLEQAVQQYFTVPGESSTVEDKLKLKGITIELEKTPNQQRKEIIEKAKGFVNENGKCFAFDLTDENIVIAFCKSRYKGKIEMEHGVAYCHPSDVFNEHIGKAIALGRALGLNVSEFEQVVQPTEVVVGMVIQDYYKFEEDSITEIDNSFNFEYINEKLECYRKGVLNHNNFNSRILNDTNAIYGGEMK